MACNNGLGATGIERSPRQKQKNHLARNRQDSRQVTCQPAEIRCCSPR
ncbi:hypothetical protein RK21_00739 [Pseudomonas plecoglossicida]|nr:hypothetical protein RK21_00739 [Pseudomonas plecoglossicida]